MTVLLWLLGFLKPVGSAIGSALQKPAVLCALAIAVLLAAVWFEDHARTAAVAREKAAAAALVAERAAEVLRAKQQAVSDASAAHDAQAQAQIQTVYRNLTQQVTRYVPLSTDAQCVVPVGAVRLLDAGAAGLQLPDAPGVADAAPSAFHLSDLALNALANLEAKRANDQQLIDLQAWIRAQQALAAKSPT
jgi:hypothetical protein